MSKAESRGVYLDSAARAALGFTGCVVPLCDVWEAWHRAPANIRPGVYQLESVRYRIHELRAAGKRKVAALLRDHFQQEVGRDLSGVPLDGLIMRVLAAEGRWVDLDGEP